MILVGAHQLEKSFGAKSLFKGLTFSVETGDRIGLIGPNGAGKSTLLKMISQSESPDGGTLSFSNSLRVAFVGQQSGFDKTTTIDEALPIGEDLNWEDKLFAEDLMAQLQLETFDKSTLVSQLSGGWQKRLAIASELLKKPDLLILDEPTNHLDVEAILWLEEYLAKASFALITVTHDRQFLQNVSNRIIELNPRFPGGLINIKGSYLDYLKAKEEQLAAQEQQEVRLKNTLRRETEWLKAGVKARTTKQKGRIKEAGQLKDKVEDLENRNKKAKVQFDFKHTGKAPKRLIELKNASKSYEGLLVVPPIDLTITPKTRLGLVGPNGCGKSTLIKLISGAEPSDSGQINRADNLELAYFEQDRSSLNPSDSGLKSICPEGDHVNFNGDFIHVRSYLARFLFTPEQMEKPVEKLSGGERARLLLARLMLVPSNVLILDEPTNDLDMETLDVLSEMLQEYQGALILVSHDRYFLDQNTEQLLAFGVDESKNKIIESLTGVDQWLRWRDQQLIYQSEPTSINISKDETSTTTKTKHISKADKKEIEKLERMIGKKEVEIEELSSQYSSPEISADPEKLQKLSKKIDGLNAELEQLFSRWESLSS